MTQVQLASTLLDVVEDRTREPAMGRSLQQIELGGFRLGRKHHEDGEHAAGGDGLAIDKAQGVGNGVPHPSDAFGATAMADEPILETDGVEGSDGAHRPLVIHQTAHYRAGAQGQGIAQLVDPAELRCGEKRLEAVKGCANGEAKIQLPQIAPLVHEQVRVLLGQKILERSHLAHQGEEVGVIKEEDVQPHLDVVTALIHPAAHLAAHEGTGFVEIHLMARIHEVHCSGEAGEAGTNDRDPHKIWSTKATLCMSVHRVRARACVDHDFHPRYRAGPYRQRRQGHPDH